MKPWKTLGSVHTKEGVLELRQRGEREFLLVIGGRVLMTSSERNSEQRLASLTCTNLGPSARVLIGGLGMAYTLRAALDVLPADAHVDVAELQPEIEAWCRGPLAALTNNSVADPRTHVIIRDVSKVIAKTDNLYDAILLDLYEGPHRASQSVDDPFYGSGALDRSFRALKPKGVLAVWSEDPDDDFLRRFRRSGFTVTVDRSGTSRVHVVYLGVKQR